MISFFFFFLAWDFAVVFNFAELLKIEIHKGVILGTAQPFDFDRRSNEDNPID
jgi:hypothetical protein